MNEDVVYNFQVIFFFGGSLIHWLFMALCFKHCRKRFHIILETSCKEMNWIKDSADTLSLERRTPQRMETI